MPIARRASLAYLEELAQGGLVFGNCGIPSALASHQSCLTLTTTLPFARPVST
jgi:hypothetical protein